MKKPAAGDKTTSAETKGDETSPSQLSSLRQLRLGQALFETTWRIAVPVIIFSGFGIFADLHLGTKPWLTLLGAGIGFAVAGFLIARLLKESENDA